MKFTGIISSIFINLMLHLLVHIQKNHDLKELTFSHLANYPRVAWIFNSSVIVTAGLRMVYFNNILKTFSLSGNLLITIVVYISLFSMMMTGLIPVSKHERGHKIFGYVMLYSSIVYLIYFHFFLNIGHGSFLLQAGRIVALAQIGGIFLLYFKYKEWGLAEAWGIFMMLVWDLYILLGFLH